MSIRSAAAIGLLALSLTACGQRVQWYREIPTDKVPSKVLVAFSRQYGDYQIKAVELQHDFDGTEVYAFTVTDLETKKDSVVKLPAPK